VATLACGRGWRKETAEVVPEVGVDSSYGLFHGCVMQRDDIAFTAMRRSCPSASTTSRMRSSDEWSPNGRLAWATWTSCTWPLQRRTQRSAWVSHGRPSQDGNGRHGDLDTDPALVLAIMHNKQLVYCGWRSRLLRGCTSDTGATTTGASTMGTPAMVLTRRAALRVSKQQNGLVVGQRN
jgi:hypothetical protein